MTSNAGNGAGTSKLGPAQLMGLAGLLRAWRTSAGERLGLGKPLSQEEVCSVLGRSVRWYRDLENGAQPRLERSVLDGLADALLLGHDERMALHYYALGGSVTALDKDSTVPAHENLQLMLEQLMPRPAYLSNRRWGIVGYNQAMAAWYPWVASPNANLMRWALLSDEARAQYVDWPKHARAYLALLRFAQAEHPQDRELNELIAEMLRDHECRRLWREHHDVFATRDGHYFRMCIPAHGFEEVEVISHVMKPATLPDHRLVVLTWLRDGGEPGTGGEAAVLRHKPGSKKMNSAFANGHSITASITADSETAARDLAGASAIPLPQLSRVAGTRCSLTLSPESRSVIWATEQDDGQWSVSEVAAYTTLVRLPHAVSSLRARAEYKQLVRHALPADETDALAQLDTLVTQYDQRAEVLREVRREISPGSVPNEAHTWHPADEI